MTEDLPVRPGDVLAGKFRIERLLGRGGMGFVVSARHIELDDCVAIKFLLPALAMQSSVVARFLREAKAARKIRSEHVAKVADIGTSPESGIPYIVMEFLDGTDLAARVAAHGPLPVEDAVEFVLQACEALAEAHAAGIVHRDLKPANLFVTTRPDGTPCIKVLDFGISKMTIDGAADGAAMTRTQGIMGSPTFMSPEQLQTPKDVDHRTDIWSLGVVLYELLTGKPPFDAGELAQLIAQILSARPTPLASLRPGIPPQLVSVVEGCLQKDRTYRIANVGDLATALAPFAPKRARVSVDRVSRILMGAGIATAPRAFPPAATVADPVDSVGVSTATPLSSEPATVPMTKPGRAVPFIVGGLLIVVVGAVGVLKLAASNTANAVANAPPASGAALVDASAATISTTASAMVATSSPAAAPAAPATSSAPATAPLRTNDKPAAAPRASASNARPAPSASAGTKPNCTLQSYFDADGNKHFKNVCN